MLHGVEFGSFGGDVGAVMSNMQTWLGNQRSQPVIFRQVAGHDGAILRLEFERWRGSSVRWCIWWSAYPARSTGFRRLTTHSAQ
jgi:hypothetical protein